MVAGDVSVPSGSARPGRLPAGVRIVLVVTALMNAGTFMALPLLAVLLVRVLHADPGSVGTVLSGYLLVSRGLPVLTGRLADRIPMRAAMVTGCLVRAGGLAALAGVGSARTALAAAVLVGAGGALYEPAMSALLAAQPTQFRARAFTLRNSALNGGAIAGPAVGGVLLAAGLRAPFLAGASVFLILAVVLLRVSIASDKGACPPPLVIRSPWRDGKFLVFLAAMTGWWVMFAQLSVGFPLRAAAVGGPRTVTLAVIVNAAFGLGAMPLVGYTIRRCTPGSGLRIGLALAAVGFALTGIVPDVVALLVGVAVYSVGETFVLVAKDVVVAERATPSRVAGYFGLASLPWLLGGTAGNYFGAALLGTNTVDAGWIALAAFGATLALVITRLIPGAGPGSTAS